MTVADRRAEILDRIDAARVEAGRTDQVRLVAVSKRQPESVLVEAYEAGQRVFAENYVQALLERQAVLPADVQWHMIGHLQTNKAKRVASAAACVHTVDSRRVGRALSRGTEGKLPVLIEVNVGAEASKSGVAPEGAAELLRNLLTLDTLQVTGLMTIPPRTAEPRRWFAALRELRERLELETGYPLPELSMGMSGDFEDAVREGATMVRVGTALFGPRAS